jgi:hypothetical protein
MNKPTTTARDWKEIRTAMHRKVPVRNGYGYHFHDAVVVRVNQFKAGAQLRTVVLRTGGVDSKAMDGARAQRMFRRLRKWAGFKATTSLDSGRVCDGLFGTVFGFTA